MAVADILDKKLSNFVFKLLQTNKKTLIMMMKKKIKVERM